MHDPIADLLTRLRNAGSAFHPTVTMPHSKMKESVAQILKTEGYINDVSVEGGPKKSLKLTLKYEGKRPVFIGLRQISTPGLRRYVGSGEIPKVLGGMGISIISTPKGVLSGSEARRQNVGGELVCYVW
jgi:small subunit ribosomal protein S8